MFNKETSNMELKEYCDRRQMLELLRQWVQAMESGKDMEIRVKERPCTIPSSAFDSGRFRVEYEIDKGEHEFELTLKWR